MILCGGTDEHYSVLSVQNIKKLAKKKFVKSGWGEGGHIPLVPP